jgi:hypothetical protein
MLARVPTRTLPLLNKAAELTPAAQACCGACRTCVTTNAFAAAGAAVLAAWSFVAQRQRTSRRSGRFR